ncbi:MAG: DCC1-like thiol-disulfide oxidoreductase family protein [Fluviicoccus sp.]|uniref:thiol-disulfide oxidoreductase DCC family protein n=1 Tax=Fluviicoccus sp. TaxID=2003552 RepID=UPI00272530CB|nr:DCC1-like thiol-disulfide oxidoreductase family protein [Fluviicoccus sp.]MDO8331689.1 DCC1-like thiol-disulfide oxidoreductase family protein [Fluviicoccus sp.]
MPEFSVMLFDGKCVFCNGAVNFALEREQQPLLRFAALQSEVGQELLRHHRLPTRDFRTFVIIRNGRAFTRFEAAVQLGYLIGGKWARLAKVLDLLVPDLIGNPVYSLLWPLRKVFGAHDQCLLPSPQLRARLLPGGDRFPGDSPSATDAA